jgi:very-short-patch-repair endonuclease
MRNFTVKVDDKPFTLDITVKVDGEPFTFDIAWIAQRVALELDSRTYHDNDPSFATDRRRSRRLGAVGWHVVRGTWLDLDERPAELAADVWALLGARQVA